MSEQKTHNQEPKNKIWSELERLREGLRPDEEIVIRITKDFIYTDQCKMLSDHDWSRVTEIYKINECSHK